MNQSLYVIASEYQAAANKLMDSELPIEVINDTLEGLSGELEVKATNIGFVVRNLESLASQIKDAEKQMADRRKSIEAKAESIRRYLKDNMQRCGITKIDSPHFSLALKKNPPSVIIDDPAAIPSEFMVTPPPPPASPDKMLIKSALQEGKEVPGCRLEQAERLEIK